MNIFKQWPELRTRNLMISILISFILMASAVSCYGGDKNDFGPWDFNTSNPEHEDVAFQVTELSPGANLLINAVRFYQTYISPVNGERCPMTPSCSAYAVQAIKKHGFFIGMMMTADRLIHESDEIPYAATVLVGDKVRFHDPVSNNDFWFDKDHRR